MDALPAYDILLGGFPGWPERGFLGWSTTVLLRTAEGAALFDTGSAGDRPGLMAALARHGLATSDIRTVVLSHLHFDHVGNVECFPQAEVVLHGEELRAFEAGGAADPAVPRLLVKGMLRACRMRIVEGEPALFPGIRMILTPGHTAGHCSLALDEAGRRVVLAQDAVKHRGELESLVSAGAVLPEAASASIRRIRDGADRIVPGHDRPLDLVAGRVLPGPRPSETLAFTIDGRTVRLEA